MSFIVIIFGTYIPFDYYVPLLPVPTVPPSFDVPVLFQYLVNASDKMKENAEEKM